MASGVKCQPVLEENHCWECRAEPQKRTERLGRGGNARLETPTGAGNVFLDPSQDTEPFPTPTGTTGTSPAPKHFGEDVQSGLHIPRSIGIHPPWEQSRAVPSCWKFHTAPSVSTHFSCLVGARQSSGRSWTGAVHDSFLREGCRDCSLVYQLHQSAFTGTKRRNLLSPGTPRCHLGTQDENIPIFFCFRCSCAAFPHLPLSSSSQAGLL